MDQHLVNAAQIILALATLVTAAGGVYVSILNSRKADAVKTEIDKSAAEGRVAATEARGAAEGAKVAVSDAKTVASDARAAASAARDAVAESTRAVDAVKTSINGRLEELISEKIRIARQEGLDAGIAEERSRGGKKDKDETP